VVVTVIGVGVGMSFGHKRRPLTLDSDSDSGTDSDPVRKGALRPSGSEIPMTRCIQYLIARPAGRNQVGRPRRL
jgi:hypothetical protein